MFSNIYSVKLYYCIYSGILINISILGMFLKILFSFDYPQTTTVRFSLTMMNIKNKEDF